MVVNQVKHWWANRANAARWRTLQEWAHGLGGSFEQTAEGQGFLIELAAGTAGALRIEWGESQRSYLPGFELRMRMTLGLHPDLQLMVVCRQLMDELERVVFEAYTDTLRTRADTDTPEEMRWLVMFPKFNHASSPIVRQRYGILGVTKELSAAWIDGELGEALVQASQDLLPEWHPFVMMVMRGNAYLRTAMPEADLPRLQAFVRLLQAAARSAETLQARVQEAGAWPSTGSMAWSNTTRPGDTV